MNRPHSIRGLTLLELMVAVAVVAVLVAIALPSYREQVQRGNRLLARTALLEAQQFMERYHATHYRYTQTPNPASPDSPSLPTRLQQVPANGAALYRLDVTVTQAHAYHIRAVPQASMSHDRCGTLQIDHQGHTAAFNVNGDPLEDCWR